MQGNDVPYVHRPVNGLPSSLLLPDGQTFAVIALMQRHAGLNRERRRELQSAVKTFRDLGNRLGSILPKSEINVLAYYLNPGERFGAFWYVVRRLLEHRGVVGSHAYAMAVDVQLLNAYEPDWLKLSLDETALVAACPEWPRIKDHLGEPLKEVYAGAPLGLFMLWPRLLADLGSWSGLGDAQRLKVGHAVFALSSVGFTDWFVSEALKHCPELESELGCLIHRPGVHDEVLESGSTAPSGEPAVDRPQDQDGVDAAPRAQRGSDFKDGWEALLQRLRSLVTELSAHPTRDAVADVIALTRELEVYAPTLPPREQPLSVRFAESLGALIAHLRALANRDGFEWLEATFIEQIESRWQLALRVRSEPALQEELTADAVAALRRTESAVTAFEEACSAVTQSQLEVVEIERELLNAKGFAQQAAYKRKRTEARKKQLDAESTQQSRQEHLVDAASPFGEPFDYSQDYKALLAGSPATVGGTEELELGRVERSTPPTETAAGEPTDKLPASSPPGVPQETQGERPCPSASSASPGSAPAEEAAKVFEEESKPVSGTVPPVPSPPTAAPVADEAAAPFNDAAGDVCRPIWRLVAMGQPALAYHASNWIATVNPGIKVPSPDLLSATALESDLLLPDGAIQTALGACLERLRPEDFAAEAPRDWHAAVNLLLASATLRPMILAPGTGAATLAGYLHQDGHYPALYALVQHLRKLSPLLMGFRIEPAVLRQARGEAAIRADLQALQHAAEDWLRVQAPAYTIKFAAATNVWRQWLRPGGEIEALVAPVEHNRTLDQERVREQLAALSDNDHVIRLIRETDRKVLKRRRGEDIHAGALDHLLRCVDEALQFPRKWLSLVELLGRQGDRMREVLEQIHARLRESRVAVELELIQAPEHDTWGLVRASQSQALKSFRGVLSLFDAGADIPSAEPPPAEALGLPLLAIPDLTLGEDWAPEATPEFALAALRRWLSEPVSAEGALQQRLERGDLLGAEMMAHAGMVESQPAQLRQERERWKQVLRREIADCRRSVEVGSAYGYLVDADRGQIESRLAQREAQLEDLRRFDVAIAEIESLKSQVADARDKRARLVRDTLRGISVTDETRPAITDIEKALNDGDIATANELVHWLSLGRPAPTDLDEEIHEGFDRFFPAAMQAIDGWLEGRRRGDIEQTLRQGHAIPGIEIRQVPGAQRDQGAKMFSAWSDMKAHQTADHSRLEPLLAAMGHTVKSLKRVEKVAGREIWNLDAAPIEDRHVCPLPMFGSGAVGKYRVVCVWGQPTEDDLLQWVGDSAVSRPALLLYFGRMTERKWRDLSRLSKTKRRSFLLLDEVLLVYLCLAQRSRLQAWFDAALPFSFSSPYDATAGLVPPEMFYGRGAELDAVRGLNGRCFIYGGRQLGKTALLKRAEQSFHAPSRGHYAKWIDLRAEGIGASRTAAEIWIVLHEKLRELGVLDEKQPVPVPAKKQGVEGLVRFIREFLAANTDRRILLLLDEADRFFELDGRSDFEETRRLKQLMDETGRRFKVVFAGLHNVLRMTERPNHPLAHFGEPIEIGPLREGDEVREAADLIRRPMAAAGFDFESRSLVIRILAQTNYYPSLIQLYCSHLLRHMLAQVANRQRPTGPRYSVTDRDIEQVYSSEALRDEIRHKFGLTLQLDPRYEVVAYAMALDLLRARYSQNDGLPWQTIRQSGAMHWWPEGFRDTSELDFRVLLDEMVGLGVLRRLDGGRYALRNPNVLLLLGTPEEIEAVLIKDREPAVEFESASFRPPLRRAPASAERNAFTYQQLSKLVQRSNGIAVVTGTVAAAIDRIVPSLQDYLGPEADPVVLSGCTDRQSFGNALGAALTSRERDLVTAIVVPDALPWTELWLAEAQQRLKRLQSGSRFASLIFVAEPATLWRLLREGATDDESQPPWMSLLHWRDEFVRHWLEDRQLRLEPEDRRRLEEATGYWPALLMELAGDCTELRSLRERMSLAESRWFDKAGKDSHWRGSLGLNVAEPTIAIEVLARLGEHVDADELALVAEIPPERVRSSLRWGELLGLTRSEGAGFWTVDRIASKALLGEAG